MGLIAQRAFSLSEAIFKLSILNFQLSFFVNRPRSFFVHRFAIESPLDFLLPLLLQEGEYRMRLYLTLSEAITY